VAIAKLATDDSEGDIQQVTIELTDGGFSPAIVVVQAGLDAEWTIVNKPKSAAADGANLLVPVYYTQLTLETGDNAFYLYPTDSFVFSTGENAFYGYVKVVDSLDTIDIEAIQREAAAFETLIYPPEFFTGGDGASCH
jgi:hypothetical protein